MPDWIVSLLNIYGWDVDWTAAWPFAILFIFAVLPYLADRFHGR